MRKFTHAHVVELERVFTTQKYITTEESAEIARSLKVGSEQVMKWFNNRRKKWKKVIHELESEVKQGQETAAEEGQETPVEPDEPVEPAVDEPVEPETQPEEPQSEEPRQPPPEPMEC